MMAERNKTSRRSIIVISSHVARGSVGNRACVFALETLGHPVWAVPTVILPWHPGRGPATRIVPDTGAFANFIDDLAGAPWLGEVGAVLTGYLGAASQAEPVARLVKAVRALSPDALYVCDPVIGDEAGLYVAEDVAEAMLKDLLPLADIATPNRFELEWLTKRRLVDNEGIVEAARSLGPARVLATSAFAAAEANIGNLLVGADGVLLAEHRLIDRPPNGPGDLTAALFLARVQAGMSDHGALSETIASVFEILSRTADRGADELMLETDAASLTEPVFKVEARRIG